MAPLNRHVEVLLATYNGERFLRPQLDSILAQTYADVSVTARDDGSTDGTQQLLREYAAAYPGRVRSTPDSGTPSGGARDNFARLIAASSANYIAFSDQDDVWLPEKLAESMAAMATLETQHGCGTPLLVFSDAQLVSSTLQPLHRSLWHQQGIDPGRVANLRQLLPQNVVTGCTMLCNRPLVALCNPMPEGVFMHDRWIALLACIFGHSSALPGQTVLYRQHGGNAVGARPRRLGLPRLWDATRRRGQWQMTEQQAAALLARFGRDLPESSRSILENFVAIRTSRLGLRRAARMVRGRFLATGLRSNMDMLWFLLTPQSYRRIK